MPSTAQELNNFPGENDGPCIQFVPPADDLSQFFTEEQLPADALPRPTPAAQSAARLEPISDVTYTPRWPEPAPRPMRWIAVAAAVIAVSAAGAWFGWHAAVPVGSSGATPQLAAAAQPRPNQPPAVAATSIETSP